MTDETNEPQEKKIIIDEDWKGRVQSEKEAAQTDAPVEGKDKDSSASEPGTNEPGTNEPGTNEPGTLPKASLSGLVTSLAMQAMSAMGLMPNPIDGKTEVALDHARHMIDLLVMLEEKTRGNQTKEETALFEHLLHELRMGFVAVQQAEQGTST